MASASLYPSSSQSQSRASQSQSQTSQASSRTSISSQQQPLRPCLKTSGSSHSRKRPSADTTPTSSSPTKKPKSSVKWREGSLEDIVRDQEKSTALVREEIRHALSQPQQSRKNACWEIKEVFTLDPWNEDAPAASLVAKHLLGLSSCSSMLGQSAADLVHAALDSWWVGREESFVIIYLRFLGSLVSAHTGYTKKVLEMLVRKFLDRKFIFLLLFIALRNVLLKYPPQSPPCCRRVAWPPFRRSNYHPRPDPHGCQVYPPARA